jgi:hypothetical protein
MTALDLRGALVEFPLHPPRAFFAKPDWLEPGQKLTVISDGPDAGRVAGYVAPWGQCLLDGRDGCLTAPSSPTNYVAAMQGETVTAEGDAIRTANVGGGVNHARLSADFRGAVNHMENTASQLMRVIYGEDDYGIWCAGALWPDVGDRDLAMIRASAVSGDWRYRPELGAFDMAGVILVNNPGYPLLRRYARRAGLAEVEVLIGGLAGVGPMDDEDCEPCNDARVADLHDALDELLAVGYGDHVEAALASIAQSR